VSKPRALGPSTLTYAGAEILARGAWFALVLALGCLLPQRDFGAWSLLMALVGLLEIGLTLGLHGPAVRWLYDRDEPSYRRILRTLLLVWLVSAAVLVLGLDLLGGAGFRLVVASPAWMPGGRLALGVAWLGAASAIPLAVLAARQQARSYSALRVATVLGPILGVVSVLALGHDNATGVLAGQLVGAVPAALVALALLALASRPPAAWGELRSMLAFGLPVLPHMMAQWVLSWSDRWLLGRLMDLETVAVYHLAYLPGLGVLLLGGALNRAWYPLLYRDLEAVDRAEQQPHLPAFTQAGHPHAEPRTPEGREAWARLGTQASAVLGLWAAGGALVALWAGELLRALPTTGYDASPGLVAFTAAGTTAGLLYLLPHNLLYHHRRTGRIPWMTAAAAGSNLALNLLLIPSLGPTGAALATVVAYALLAALFWWQAGRVSRSPVNGFGLLRATGPALVAMAVAMVLGAAEPSWPIRVGLQIGCTAGLALALVRGGSPAALMALLRAR
jgi:O-antigen/teichoic acid export membrane protein